MYIAECAQNRQKLQIFATARNSVENLEALPLGLCAERRQQAEICKRRRLAPLQNDRCRASHAMKHLMPDNMENGDF